MLELWNVLNIKEFHENLRSKKGLKSVFEPLLFQTSVWKIFGMFGGQKKDNPPPPQKKARSPNFLIHPHPPPPPPQRDTTWDGPDCIYLSFLLT
jgi:hypothetical protein